MDLGKLLGGEEGGEQGGNDRKGHLKNLNVNHLPFLFMSSQQSLQAFVSLQIKSWITVTKLFFCHRKQNVKELKLTMLKEKYVLNASVSVGACSILFVAEILNSFSIRKEHSCIFICQKVSRIRFATSLSMFSLFWTFLPS